MLNMIKILFLQQFECFFDFVEIFAIISIKASTANVFLNAEYSVISVSR